MTLACRSNKFSFVRRFLPQVHNSNCSYFHTAVYVSVQVDTKGADGERIILHGATKKRRFNTKEIVFKEAMSFNLSDPSYRTLRKQTKMTVLIHGCDCMFRHHRLGEVELGLEAKDPHAAGHWNEAARLPNTPIVRTNSVYRC